MMDGLPERALESVHAMVSPLGGALWFSAPPAPPPTMTDTLSSWLPAFLSSPPPPPAPFLPQESQVAVVAAASFLAMYSLLEETHQEYIRLLLIPLLPATVLLPSWHVCQLAFATTLFAFLYVTWPLKVSRRTPGPYRSIPYFGAIYYIFRNRLRLPSVCHEFSQRYGGRTCESSARLDPSTSRLPTRPRCPAALRG
jgi:hypothetical protein